MSTLLRYEHRSALSIPPEALAFEQPQKWLTEHHVFQTTTIEPARDLSALEGAIAEARSGFSQYDPSADGFLAPRLHRALPLSRKEAADRLLWGWLGTAFAADYVAYRWAPGGSGEARSSARFTGNKVRQTFARLWWAAELTRGEGDDYALTERLFSLSGVQDVYEAIFGRAFCAYRPATSAFIKEVAPAKEKVVRETAKELSNLLTTVVLEAFTEEELRSILSRLRTNVERRA